MISLWLDLGLALAQVAVDDATGCVDGPAVERALQGVAGASRQPLEISVLPEGEERAIHLVWTGVGERDLEIAVGDCGGLPQMIALATERVLSDLPRGLRARRSPWSVSVGALGGSGVDRWAPRAGLWLDGVGRGRWTGALGGALSVGSQPLGSGSTWTTGAELRGGLVAVLGRARLDVGATAGAAVARGFGLADTRTAIAPRLGLRAGGSTAGPLRAGLFGELAVIRPVWSVVGGARAPEPVVRLQLELGSVVGDGGGVDRAQ